MRKNVSIDLFAPVFLIAGIIMWFCDLVSGWMFLLVVLSRININYSFKRKLEQAPSYQIQSLTNGEYFTITRTDEESE